MALTCKIFGHVYSEEDTEQKEQMEDGNKLLVDYSVKVCQRCGSTKEEKVRTQIRNEETDDVESEETDDVESEETDDKVTSRYKSTSTLDSSTASSEPKTSNAQGGVILKSTDSDTNDTESESNVAEDPDKEFVQEDGAVVYENSSTDGVRTRITCDSCEYSEVSVAPSRRDGDLCTECGGWLKLEQLDQREEQEEN